MNREPVRRNTGFDEQTGDPGVAGSPGLMFVTTIPFTIRIFLRGQIDYLKRGGFAVSAVSSPTPDLEKVRESFDIDVHPIPFTRSISPIKDLVALVKLWRLFRRHRPDIVNASTPKAGPLGILAAFFARTRVRIYTVRGIMTKRRSGPARLALIAMEWSACRLATRVIAVSPSVRDLLVSQGLCPQRKITVLGAGSSNGVDAEGRFNPARVNEAQGRALRERLGIPDDAEVVGYVGRLAGSKRIRDLAAAWQQIKEKRPLTHLLLIGPSEPLDPIGEDTEKRIREDDRVHAVGMVEAAFLPAYYALMNVLAFPTESEGFPNVPMEAGSMEIPVVATRVTGCVDAIVDGVTGTLVELGDPQGMAQAAIHYLENPEKARRHGRAARERALRDYRPERIWELVYREHRDLLAQHGLPN